MGPLQQRLESFGDLQCIVAGQYAEVSQHTHDLLKKLASSKAAHISHFEGRHVSDQEEGILLNQLRRRLSIAIVTSQSNCILSRLGHYSPGAKEAAQRRAIAKHREENVARHRLAHHEAHIRGRRLKNIGVIRI